MELTEQCGRGHELEDAARMFEEVLSVEELNQRQPPAKSAVFTPWIATWLMVYQRLCGNGSLVDALSGFTQLPAHLLPDNRRTRKNQLSANTGGFARARQRLAAAVAEWAADTSYQSLVATTAPSLDQRRVLTIDGSTLSLAATATLRRAYPPAQNQHGTSHWPVLHLVAAHELSSGCAVRPEVGPMYGAQAIGEVALATQLLERLSSTSVLLADRNFGVFAFAWAATQAGHDAVLRLTEKRFAALVRKAEAIGPGQWRLHWRPSRWDCAHHPSLPSAAALMVHLYEIPVTPELTLWLVSTVPASAVVLAELYGRRQDIETDLRDYKRTLQMDQLRGQSPDMIRKELAAATIAYNLVMLVRRLGAARADVEPRRLSFARVYSLVKNILLHNISTRDPHELNQRLEQVLRMSAQCKLPNRPGRNYPRTILTRRRKYPPRTSPPP